MRPSHYFRCTACGGLVGPTESPVPPRLECCTRPRAETWPSTEATKLLSIAGEQNLGRVEGRRVAAVFLAFALERMLEEASRPILRSGDYPKGHMAFRNLFEQRTRRPMQSILSAAGLRDFDRAWSRLVTLRNQIAHGRFSVDRTMTSSALSPLRRDALAACAVLYRAALRSVNPQAMDLAR